MTASALNTLTEFSDSLNSRTYTLSGHTAVKPKLVIQKRRVPTGQQSVLEDTIKVVQGTNASDGSPIQEKVTFEVKVRRPIGALQADIDSARTAIQNIVQSAEFSTVVNTQGYLS